MCKKKSISIFVASLVILAILPVSMSMGEQEKPIKVGLVSSTTGYISGLGLDNCRGFGLSVEDINNKGGVLGRKLEYVFSDAESSVQKAVAIVKRFLYDEKVIGIFGLEGPHICKAVRPMIEKEGIPTIVFPIEKDVWEGTKFMFSGSIPDVDNAKATVSVIVDYLKIDKLGIIHDSGEYGTTSKVLVMEALKDRGDKVKVVGVEQFTTSTAMDCTPQVLNVKNAGATGLFLSASMGNVVLKIIREIGWDVPIVVAPGATSERFLKVTGKDSEGVIGTSFRGMGMDPENQSPQLRYMSKLYKEKYGTDPTLFSITGWDIIKIFAHAMEMAKSDDPKKIRDALENVRGLRLAMGEANFSPVNHGAYSIKDVGVVIAKQGRWVGLNWFPKE
jgi:branched-chain amino acid transport system substrate-binding protein